MAKSALPLLLGVGALLLLKSKGGAGSGSATLPPGDEPVNGGGGSTGGGATGSSGYKDVTASQMKVIQQQLTTLGYNPGKIDGQWRLGGSTYNAVKAFQGDNGLTIDGKPGPNTRAKLNAMTGTSSGTSTGSSTSSGSGSSSGQQYSLSQLQKVPPAGSNQVTFNATLTDFDMGPSWRYATLDKWLNGRRTSGYLATKSNGAPNYDTDYSAADIMASAYGEVAGTGGAIALLYGGMYLAPTIASVPIAVAAGASLSIMSLIHYDFMADYMDDFYRKKAIEQTGALALKRFVETQKVLVGPEKIPVKVKDLQRTEAVVEFLKQVSDYIARFQSSTYE